MTVAELTTLHSIRRRLTDLLAEVDNIIISSNGYPTSKTGNLTEDGTLFIYKDVSSIERIPVKAARALHDSGIHNVYDLVIRTESQLREIKYIGRSSIRKMGKSLGKHGLTFGMIL